MFDLVVTFTGLIVFVFGGGYEDPKWVKAVWVRAPQHQAVLTYDPRNEQIDRKEDPASPNLGGDLLGRLDLIEKEISLTVTGGSSFAVSWRPPNKTNNVPDLGGEGQASWFNWAMPLESLRISALDEAVWDPPYTLSTGELLLGGGTLTAGQIAIREGKPVIFDFKRSDKDHNLEHSQALAISAELRFKDVSAAFFTVGDRVLTLDRRESGPPEVRVAITNLPGFTSPILNPDSLEQVRTFYRVAKDRPVAPDQQYRPVVGGDADTIADEFCPFGRIAAPVDAGKD